MENFIINLHLVFFILLPEMLLHFYQLLEDIFILNILILDKENNQSSMQLHSFKIVMLIQLMHIYLIQHQ